MLKLTTVITILTLVEVSSQQCTHGDVRLVGDCLPNQGRVEVCVNSTWGTVCDDGWGVQDAMVVCGQLGYPRNGSRAFGNAYFGQGTGPIVLDDVECNPTVHRRLLECPSLIGPLQHNCNHFEDAGVACSGLKRVEGNVSVSPVGVPSAVEVLLTWKQGNSQEQNGHSSFRVECTSRLHSVTVSVVRNQSFTTPIGGLLPSTSYNCCVSALYEKGYTGEGTCMLIETQTSTTIDLTVLPSLVSTTPQVVPQGVTTSLFPLMSDKTAAVSNIVCAGAQSQLIGGVLGFVILLLLILLVLMGTALGCVLLRTKAKKAMGPQDIPHQTETLRHQEGAISVETAVTAPAQVVTHNNVANQLQENTPTYVNFGQAEYEPMDYVKEEKQVTFNDASNYGNVYELDDDSCVEEDHYKVPRSIAKW